jgi:hypothetical protein
MRSEKGIRWSAAFNVSEMNNKVKLEVLVRQFIGLSLAESYRVGGFVYIFLAPSVGNGRSQRR